jgi:hypothetical protein
VALANPVPGPPTSVLQAVLRTDPANPPQPGDTSRATFTSHPVFPLLASLMTDVVDMPQDAILDANVEITGTLVSNGWATEAVTTVTSNYTPLPSDAVILANATSGAVTVTLPDATQNGFSPGQRYTIKKTDGTANTVTVATSAGQQIDGGSTVVLSAGNSETSVVFDGTTSNNWWTWSGITVIKNYLGVFGDGSDGAVTLDGSTSFTGFSTLSAANYTLTRDVYATNLTVNAAATLTPAGWRVFCQGTFTNAGTVTAVGGAGNANGNAGLGTAGGSFNGSSNGGAGGTATASAGGSNTNPGFGSGGTGGTGTGGAGGAGGTSGSSSTATYRNPYSVLAGLFRFSGNNCALSGGPGGGGGGGDNTNKGGGGGAGGGSVAIYAYAVVNNGAVNTTGGAGGTPTAGNTGGGGGGAAGDILYYTLSAATGGGTTNVNGGAAGSPHGTGTNNATAGGGGNVLNIVLT